MFGLDQTQLAGIAALAAGGIGLLWQNRAALAGLIPSLGGGDDDAKDFAALTRLQKRFARLKCPEGQAALQTCMTHFFHGDEA